MELYGRDKVKLGGNTLNVLLNFKSLYCNAFYEIKNSIYVHNSIMALGLGAG